MVQSQPNRTRLIIVPNETLELVEYRKHRESACSEYRQGFVLQISGGQCCVSNICNLTGKWTSETVNASQCNCCSIYLVQ